MPPINRMENPVIPKTLDEINLLDPELQECPYHAYALLRREAPVFRDPGTRFVVVSRYDDLRDILADSETFASSRSREQEQPDQARAQRMIELYESKGWLPSPTLSRRDDPNHKQMRAVFETAFRASKIKALDPVVEALAYRLIDAFLPDGQCEFVRQFAVPLPLIVIGQQMGAPEQDIWRIKRWTDSWVKRLGLMMTEAEMVESIELEIEAQHYFQAIFERLRKQPDDTLLSELVNRVIPEWGRPLSDNDLHAAMMADTFVGGSETTTNALSAGIMLLGQNKDVWHKLKSDPDAYLRTFVEEVVRLETPVQGLIRRTTKQVVIAGQTIPADTIINVRYAAANRDESHFPCPEKIDLERRNAGSHLGFASGTHHCLGAPLARRELWWGFKAFLDRIEDFELTPGRNDLRHVPNFYLRALKELHIDFTPRKIPAGRS